jgi:hypothetical protein
LSGLLRRCGGRCRSATASIWRGAGPSGRDARPKLKHDVEEDHQSAPLQQQLFQLVLHRLSFRRRIVAKLGNFDVQVFQDRFNIFLEVHRLGMPQRLQLARLFLDRRGRIRDDFFAESADAVGFPDEESVHTFERDSFAIRRAGNARDPGGRAGPGFIFDGQVVDGAQRSDDQRAAERAPKRAARLVCGELDLLAAARAADANFPVILYLIHFELYALRDKAAAYSVRSWRRGP